MRGWAWLALAALGGCSEAEQRPASEKVAEIERANDGTAVAVSPEPILYPDIEANQLTDPACSFAPEGGGMAPVLLAMDERAVMKIGREIAEFAPDKGSAKVAQLGWSKYDGRAYSIRFKLGEQDAGAPSGNRFAASLELRDGQDRVVYQAQGYAQCP